MIMKTCEMCISIRAMNTTLPIKIAFYLGKFVHGLITQTARSFADRGCSSVQKPAVPRHNGVSEREIARSLSVVDRDGGVASLVDNKQNAKFRFNQL